MAAKANHDGNTNRALPVDLRLLDLISCAFGFLFPWLLLLHVPLDFFCMRQSNRIEGAFRTSWRDGQHS